MASISLSMMLIYPCGGSTQMLGQEHMLGECIANEPGCAPAIAFLFQNGTSKWFSRLKVHCCNREGTQHV